MPDEKDPKKETRRETKKETRAIKKGEISKFKAASADAPKPEEKKKETRVAKAPAPLILIAEDTAPIRNIMKNYLTAAGYEVMDAADGAIAVNLATQRKPDLVLLDINMPKMDGFSVCKALRQKEGYEKIPIVICTARGLREDVVEALKVGANDYIVKPFSKDVLLTKVKKFLAR